METLQKCLTSALTPFVKRLVKKPTAKSSKAAVGQAEDEPSPAAVAGGALLVAALAFALSGDVKTSPESVAPAAARRDEQPLEKVAAAKGGGKSALRGSVAGSRVARGV